MKKTFAYKDIALVPNCGIADSRSECVTAVEFLGKHFSLPVIPANMRCSIDFEKAAWCINNNIFYILHRFYPYEEIVEWMDRNQSNLISISIGVQERDAEFIKRLASNLIRVDFITIDIAHGHCLAMKRMLELIHSLTWRRDKPKIIAGNVTTREGTQALVEWGADAVKVGIGQGHVCTTRLETGFGMPMFSTVQECSEDCVVPIIADGGISHYGDLAKAMVAGASMVMSGSMFARCLDSPAEHQWVFGKGAGQYKKWYGSASEENKGQDKYVEGKCVIEETNYLTYEQMIRKWKEAFQSAISYAGGYDVRAFNKVSYTLV